MPKRPKNEDIAEQLKKLNISSRSFQAGEIYLTEDVKVRFPGRAQEKIEDKPRMVIVLGNDADLNDPLLPYVPVIPITTRLDGQIRHDIPLEQGEGSLDKKSIAKAGMVQPILKNDLTARIGKIDKDTLQDLHVQITVNLGILEDE